MKKILRVLCAFVFTLTLVGVAQPSFAQSSAGQMPCSFLLTKLRANDQAFYEKTVDAYASAFVDGFNVQRIWGKLPGPAQIFIPSDDAIRFVTDYCRSNPNDVLLIAVVQLVSEAVKKNK